MHRAKVLPLALRRATRVSSPASRGALFSPSPFRTSQVPDLAGRHGHGPDAQVARIHNVFLASVLYIIILRASGMGQKERAFELEVRSSGLEERQTAKERVKSGFIYKTNTQR